MMVSAARVRPSATITSSARASLSAVAMVRVRRRRAAYLSVSLTVRLSYSTSSCGRVGAAEGAAQLRLAPAVAQTYLLSEGQLVVVQLCHRLHR